jgi:alkanesulfonate monooxygenase
VKVGLHVADFTWPGGTSSLARDLVRVAQAAEANGFHTLGVMDHFWQVGHNGPPENAMLEAYTTLGFLAGHTSRLHLSAWVSCAVYRQPGVLAKAVSTLT